ncbi:MAG: ribonuclease III domain-containing protein [Verrucomicrobiota bacterium]
MSKSDLGALDEARMREKAWIGDAVLALFSRIWLLEHKDFKHQELRNKIFIRMTSNRFLSSLGEPTKVEAEIGLVYEREGLESAFSYLEGSVVPLVNSQLANLRKSNPGKKLADLV